MKQEGDFTKKAAIYARVSTKDQSVTTQMEILTRFCVDNNYGNPFVYKDEGFSGKTIEKRVDYNRMIEDVREGKINIIICKDIDRISRSVRDLLDMLQILDEFKCDFRSVNQPIFDLKTPTGKLMVTVIGAIAEFERSLILNRMKEGRVIAIEKGVICNRPKIELSKQKMFEYFRKGLSANAISKIFGCSVSTVTRRAAEWGYVHVNNKWRRFLEEDNDYEVI